MKSVLVVFAAALAACGTGPESPPVELAITASSNQITLGQPDTFTVSIHNRNSSSVTLHFATGCQLQVFIRDSAGVLVVPQSGPVCTQVLSSLSLGGKETRTTQVLWDGGAAFIPPGLPTQSGPQRSAAGSAPPLPPGQYDVFAGLAAMEASVASPVVRVRLLQPS